MLAWANAINSAWYEVTVAFSLDAGSIRSASASLAFLLAIMHSSLHLGVVARWIEGPDVLRLQ